MACSRAVGGLKATCLTRTGTRAEIETKQALIKEPTRIALLTLEEAAARIDVPRETIEEWIRSGLLTTRRLPRPRKVPADAGDCNLLET